MGYTIDIAGQNAGNQVPPLEPPPAKPVVSTGSSMNLSNATPAVVAVAGASGSANSAARADHVHTHGNQTDPDQHALVTPLAHGFMSSGDKAVFDTRTPAATPDAMVQRDADGRAQIQVPHSDNSALTTIEEFLRTTASPGLISGGEITVASATQVSVAAGAGLIRVADDDTSEIRFVVWPTTLLTIPDDSSMRFIGVTLAGDSNGAEVVLRTSFDWDHDTEWSLGSAVQINSNIFPFSNPYKIGDSITNVIQRFDAIAPAMRDHSLGGLVLGETGTRNITLSAGRIWYRLTDKAVAAKDTSGSDRFATAYYNGSTWVYSAGVTVAQWPNTEYNDTASGLVTMANNHYANLWFYVSLDSGTLLMLYGQAEYNQVNDALSEAPPSLVPTNLPTHALLVGRLTFQKSAAAAVDIVSAFVTPFELLGGGSGGGTDHGALTGLSDDDHPQYHNDARGDARYGRLAVNNAWAGDQAIGPAGTLDGTLDTALHVKAEGRSGRLVNQSNSDTAGSAPGFNAYRARGTLAAPTAVLNGDATWGLFASAYTGSTWVAHAAIRATAAANQTASSTPSAIAFETTAASSTTRVARLTIDRDQEILSTLRFRAPNGTEALPAYSFSAANAAGMYWTGSSLNFSVSGAARLGVSASVMQPTVLVRGVNGTAAAPAYSFTGATGDGFYRATNLVGMSIGGIEYFRWRAGAVEASGSFYQGAAALGATFPTGCAFQVYRLSSVAFPNFTAGTTAAFLARSGGSSPSIVQISSDNTARASLQLGDSDSHAQGLIEYDNTNDALRLGANGTSGLVVLDSNDLTSTVNIAAPTFNDLVIASGTYTPTLTGVSNVAAASASLGNYMRIGNVVQVGVRITLDPTAGATTTELRVSLPIASALTSVAQVTGVASRDTPGQVDLSSPVVGDITNDEALMRFMNDADVANRAWFLTFSYQIL